MNRTAAVALMSGLLVLAGCGGDPSTASQQAEEAVDGTVAATTTATVSTTTTVTPTTTTAPPTTTVAPTTTLAAATLAGLIRALPGPLDLPQGWVSAGGMPSGELTPLEGDYVGICGGPNADMRAVNNGVLLTANAPAITAPDGAILRVSLFAFASDEAAKATIDATYAQTGCGYREFKMHEGSDVGQYDGFSGTYGAKAVWTVRENLAVGNPGVTDAPGAILISKGTEYIVHFSGIDYGSKDTVLTIWEQHGRFILLSSLYGPCCTYGYSNITAALDVTPSLDELNGVMTTLRPLVVGRLGEFGFLAV